MKQSAIKKQLVTFILILELAVITTAGSVMAEEASQPQTLKVALLPFSGTDSEWWSLNQETGEFEGYVIDIFRAIEETEEGLTFTFEAFPIYYEYPNGELVLSDPECVVLASEAGYDIAISEGFFYSADEEHPADICYLAFDKPWLLWR